MIVKILITGAAGFIGKNFQQYLSERKEIEYAVFTREQSVSDLPQLLADVDAVVHLAGINRPKDISEFDVGNVQLTDSLVESCDAIYQETGKAISIIYSSSAQAAKDNPYGNSKSKAEKQLTAYSVRTGAKVSIFRLPNVFGKWCKPDYNSAVATFCHNVARGLPITINDRNAALKLVYIDDVIETFYLLLSGVAPSLDESGFAVVLPQYDATVGEIADYINAFRISRDSLVTEAVGTGFLRALYSTYVSYFPVEDFVYSVPKYGDARGVFVEMLKTTDSGQFSFFTAHVGITRGGHYHHTKTEKFLVIKGLARFKFRHMWTGEEYEITTSGDDPKIVETVPGWTHDITNIGSDEMIVMLWANEIFDRQKPDTYACPL